MKFLALDVETANADYSSICQIGIVEFHNGEIIDKWSSLINPEAFFDPFNISIHGIAEKDVEDSPTFDQIHKVIEEKITDKITLHHMPFDKIALARACEEYKLNLINARWLDSAKIVRRTWEEFAHKGYGLSNIAKHLMIEFKHHDALEDACATAEIVYQACNKTGLSIEDWFAKTAKGISDPKNYLKAINQKGNPEGPLRGENIVFTGSLFLPRKDVSKIASDLGCDVGNSVSKKTTMLVVGTQDSSKLGGYEKSSKHRKAETLNQKGSPIKILSEKDFLKICKNEDESLKLEIPKKSEKDIKKENDPPIKNTMSIEIDTTEIESFIKKNSEALSEMNNEWQNVLDSIVEPTHEGKRKLGKEIKVILKKVGAHTNVLFENHMEYYDVVQEVDDIEESLFELTKNKISLASLFDEINDCVDEIDSLQKDPSYYEFDEIPDNINEHLSGIKHLLEEICKKILVKKKSG